MAPVSVLRGRVRPPARTPARLPVDDSEFTLHSLRHLPCSLGGSVAPVSVLTGRYATSLLRQNKRAPAKKKRN